MPKKNRLDRREKQEEHLETFEEKKQNLKMKQEEPLDAIEGDEII